jgi:integrase
MLTDLRIKHLLKAENLPKERKEHPDGKGGVRGLHFIVQPTGAASWGLRYRFHGRTRKLTLGGYPDLDLRTARKKAEIERGKLGKGDDPAAIKKAERAAAKAEREATTLDGLIDDWNMLHLAEKRASYSREAVRALRYAFEKHLNVPAASLDRAAVVRVLDGITKDGKKAITGRTAAYGRACYQWAVKRGSLKENPFASLPLAPVVKRERMLTDDELRLIWKATERPGSFNAIVRMLILTGQRREEVAGMTWGELAPDLSTWTIPASRAKNNAEHIVPLSLEAQAIVRAAPRIVGSNLVFAGQRGVFAGWSNAKDDLDAASGVKDWWLHDLRRTCATGLQRLGVRLEVTESILNHISGSHSGIVGVYQKYTWDDEKRVALQMWADRLSGIVSGESDRKVVPFARSKSNA